MHTQTNNRGRAGKLAHEASDEFVLGSHKITFR
jgi:hypothetical protein